MRSLSLCCITFLSIENTHAAQTFYCDTIAVSNNNPIAMLFAHPKPSFDTSELPGTITLKATAELSNYISTTNGLDDKLRLDGETWRMRNEFKYQINEYFHIQFQRSWLKHSGGISDRFIYHFHDVLALPQNGRSDQYHDQLYWQIQVDGNQLVNLKNDHVSWGDTELTLSWKPQGLDTNTQYNASLKLPTGEDSPFSSSGNFDFNLSLSTQNPDWFESRDFLKDKALSLWYGAGLGYLGKTKELDGLSHYHISLALRTGAAWSIFTSWILKMQLDAFSPLLDTNLRELGWVPIQISFESAHQLSDNIWLSAMIGEDIRPRSVPDVVLGTGLSIKF